MLGQNFTKKWLKERSLEAPRKFILVCKRIVKSSKEDSKKFVRNSKEVCYKFVGSLPIRGLNQVWNKYVISWPVVVAHW